MDDEEWSLKTWLAGFDFTMYERNFTACGYDSRDAVARLDDGKLKNYVKIELPGHRDKLMAEVEKLRQPLQTPPVIQVHALPHSPSSLSNFTEAKVIPRMVPPRFHWFFDRVRREIPDEFFPSLFQRDAQSSLESKYSDFGSVLCKIWEKYGNQSEPFLSWQLTTLISEWVKNHLRGDLLVSHLRPVYYDEQERPDRRNYGSIDVAIESCNPDRLLSLIEVKTIALDPPDERTLSQLFGYAHAYLCNLSRFNEKGPPCILSLPLLLTKTHFIMYGLFGFRESAKFVWSLLGKCEIKDELGVGMLWRGWEGGMRQLLQFYATDGPGVDVRGEINNFPVLFESWELSKIKPLGPNVVGYERKVYKFFDYRPLVRYGTTYRRERKNQRKPNLEIVRDFLDGELEEESDGGRLIVLKYPFIEGNHTPKSLGQFIAVVKQCTELQKKGLVHGDIRDVNIIFPSDAQQNGILIDFDFSGEETSIYPPNFECDCQTIPERDPSIRPQQHLAKSHDVHSLQYLYRYWFDDQEEFPAGDINDFYSWLLNKNKNNITATPVQCRMTKNHATGSPPSPDRKRSRRVSSSSSSGSSSSSYGSSSSSLGPSPSSPGRKRKRK